MAVSRADMEVNPTRITDILQSEFVSNGISLVDKTALESERQSDSNTKIGVMGVSGNTETLTSTTQTLDSYSTSGPTARTPTPKIPDGVIISQKNASDSDPESSGFFRKFLEEFRSNGKRAIFLGVIERDVTELEDGTNEELQFPVETSQHLDKSSLSFRASSGDTVATLVINANKKQSGEIPQKLKLEKKPTTISDLLTSHRAKRSRDDQNIYYHVTEYEYQDDHDATVLGVSNATPTASIDEGAESYLNPSYNYKDDKCKPKSVMVEGDDSYFHKAVPGVACDTHCAACEDGSTYKAVFYPMPTLRMDNRGADQIYYKTTRPVPVYCSCFKDDDPFGHFEHTI
jgi:hypothetical protein